MGKVRNSSFASAAAARSSRVTHPVTTSELPSACRPECVAPLHVPRPPTTTPRLLPLLHHAHRTLHKQRRVRVTLTRHTRTHIDRGGSPFRSPATVGVLLYTVSRHERER